jgi:hypothetical protein
MGAATALCGTLWLGVAICAQSGQKVNPDEGTRPSSKASIGQPPLAPTNAAKLSKSDSLTREDLGKDYPTGATGKIALQGDAERSKPVVKVLYDWGPWVFNLCLVIVGGLQVWLLKVTWRTIGLQASLQEFGLRQWVEIGAWQLSRESPRDGAGMLKKSLSLQYTFVMFNRTPLPVSIKRIAVRVIKSGWQAETFEMNEEFYVPPNDDAEAFRGFLPIDLDEDQVKQYEESRFLFEVTGEVFQMAPKGTLISQPFRRTVQCGPDKDDAFKYVGRNLQKIGETRIKENRT